MLEDNVDRLHVIVDDDVPAENIQRLARSQGWDPAVEKHGDDIHLTLCRTEAVRSAPAATETSVDSARTDRPRVVVFVASRLFGEGDEKLGQILMRAFVKTLKELDPRPSELIFANSGVQLTTEGSPLIEDLQQLADEGIAISSCGTCLDFYGLKDALEVGVASNMYDIATSLVQADRVVKP
jgi:selenium metabolism protein YedF